MAAHWFHPRRCLAEGAGDVAFVKHSTVLENTDGEWRGCPQPRISGPITLPDRKKEVGLTDGAQLLCGQGNRLSCSAPL